MTSRRFRVGERVSLTGVRFRGTRSVYEIVRKMPEHGREPQYRLRSVDDDHERVVAEHEMRLLEE